jgi:hypothetical protein
MPTIELIGPALDVFRNHDLLLKELQEGLDIPIHLLFGDSSPTLASTHTAHDVSP